VDSSARSVDRFSRIREALRCCELTRRARTFERMAAGSAYNDQGLVFSDELGDLVSPDWFTRATKRFATEAGVPALTPHAAARHTWATLALSSGVHPKMVQERPGHSSIALTMDRYSHFIDGMDREAAELVAALYRCCKSFAGSIHSTQRTC